MLFLTVMPVFAVEKESTETLGGPELLLELLILVVVGGIIYNLWTTMSSFGGMIGNALRFIGAGILLFSFEAIDKALEHFELDYIDKILGAHGEEIFHDVLKLIGLFFLAWGLSNLTKIVKSAKS